MSKIVWDADGERLWETGVDHCVVYPKTGANGAYGNGVAFNGVTAVNEAPTGGEASPFYADNIKYANILSNEEFGFTLEAYWYPEEFGVCNGEVESNGVILTGQPRKEFGFSYRTLIGNDVDGSEKGYQIHIVYNCLATPTDKSHSTVNDSPELETFSWEVTTTPADAGDTYKKTAHLYVDSTKADATKLANLEKILYGDAQTEPSLPSIATVLSTIG